MIFQIDSTTLSKVLQAHMRTLSKVLFSPILFKIDNKNLQVFSTDHEVFLYSDLNLDENHINCTQNNGMFTAVFESQILFEMMKVIPQGPITFKFEKGICEVQYANGKYRIPYTDDESVFETPSKLADDYQSFVLPKVQLAQIIPSLTPFVSTDELRPAMTGFHVNLTSEYIDLATSNMRSMGLSRISNHSYVTGCLTASQKTIQILSLFLKEKDDSTDVSFSFDAKNVVILSGKNRMVAKTIDGKFPNYNFLIKDYPKYWDIDKNGFLTSLNRCLVFANLANQVVFEAKDGTMTVRGQDNDLGRASEEFFEVSGNSLEPIVFSLDGQDLCNALRNIPDDVVTIKYTDAQYPFVLQGTHADNQPGCIFFMMPMAYT